MLGCGLPGGEQGFNLARVVAVLLGHDHLPGTTVNRYCSSSLQTTRMAFHAIKAGEGDVYISAGVECVSRFAKGSSDSWPDTKNPLFADAQARTAQAAAGDGGTWPIPREDGAYPGRLYRHGRNRRKRRRAARHHPRSSRTSSACARRTWRRRPSPTASGRGRSPPSPCPTAPSVSADDGPRPGTTIEKVAALKPVFRPDGTVTAGNCLPAQRRRRRGGVMSDVKAAELGLTPLARIVSIRGDRAVPRDHGPGTGAASAGPRAGRDGDRGHRPGRDQRGVRGPGIPPTRNWASTTTSST